MDDEEEANGKDDDLTKATNFALGDLWSRRTSTIEHLEKER